MIFINGIYKLSSVRVFLSCTVGSCGFPEISFHSVFTKIVTVQYLHNYIFRGAQKIAF